MERARAGQHPSLTLPIEGRGPEDSRKVRKLAIVGASARAAAFSAMRAGYEVVTADLFADADLERVAPATRVEDYPEGLAEWLATVDCDAWMYTGALENYPDLIDRMAAIRPLLGNDGKTLRRVREPARVLAMCAATGVAMPETRFSADDLAHDGSWLCKTYRGASGSGVWALDGLAARQRAQRDGAVFQRRVNGIPAAAIYVVGGRRVELLGVSRQIMHGDREGRWQYAGSIGPLPLNPSIEVQLQTIGESLMTYGGLCGIVGVDLVIDDRTAWLIEINPRYTASVELLERFRPALVIAAHAVACVEKSTSSRTGFLRYLSSAVGRTFAKQILYARRDVIISPPMFAWMMGESAIDPPRCSLADIPHAGETIPAGRPVLTAFASGCNEQECQQQLEEWLAEIKRRLYD